MAQSFLSRLAWALALWLSQGLVFNQIHLGGYATPVAYVYVLCLQPLNASRSEWLLWGFAMGLAADFFTATPGLGAASMTLAALAAPRLLGLFAPKDCVEDLVPGFRVLQWKYVWYVSLLVLLQQGAALALEFFSFSNAPDMLYTYLGSSALTVALILAMDKMRGGK